MLETGLAARRNINPYVELIEDYSSWVFLEDQAALLKRQWADLVFKSPAPVDVEIGTGNGFHFSNYAKKNPLRSLIGFEIKYKTVVQTIARARREGCDNVRMVKGDAKKLTEYFSDGEVHKILIHFPDPWPKIRQQKNRLLSTEFFNDAHRVLTSGGVLEFKTDHFGYFRWAVLQAAASNFTMEFYTEDLHGSFKNKENFITQFESLFLQKKQAIFYFALRK